MATAKQGDPWVLLMSWGQVSALVASHLTSEWYLGKNCPLFRSSFLIKCVDWKGAMSPSGHILKSFLAVILISYTYLPTYQSWNFPSPKTFAQSQACPKTVFHFIFLVANWVNRSSHCGTRTVVTGTILIHVHFVFCKRAPKCTDQGSFA